MDTNSQRCPLCSRRISAEAGLCPNCFATWAAPSRQTVLEEQLEPLRIPPGEVDGQHAVAPNASSGQVDQKPRFAYNGHRVAQQVL